MAMAFEFPDSEVGSVTAAGDRLGVKFSAAHVHLTGTHAAEGYASAIELVFHGARWDGDPALCFGALSDGRLRDQGIALPRIPLPYRSAGRVNAELSFRNGECLSIEAASATLQGEGECHFMASHAC